MLLIKSISTYTPEPVGNKDILISGNEIAYVGTDIDLPQKNFPQVEVLDGAGMVAIPGLIDLHVHIAGGGGEGGYTTRTPEIMLTSLTLSGITTCVGLLGTDGTTRSMANLLAKARSLEEEGLSTYLWTGSYEVPTRTLTDSSRSAIILIDKIIGTGEIAVSDHRASHPSNEDLIHLAADARVGGLLSGKCGILHMHLGDGKEGLSPITKIVEESDIPPENLLPTHVNRNSMLFKQALQYAKKGGYVDITTGIVPEGDDAIHPVEALQQMLNYGVPLSNITMSSDAGGSMPIFDGEGKLIKLGIGGTSTNLEIIRGCIKNGLPLKTAITPLTSSPANLLKLKKKGQLKEGYHADIVILDKELKVHTVIANGKLMVKDYKPVVFGTFEQA